MENSRENTLRLLRAYLDQTPVRLELPVDWRRIYHYALIHQVAGMIASVIPTLPQEEQPEEKIRHGFDIQFTGSIVKSVAQEKGMEEILRELNAAHISHVLIKGYVLKSLYPVPDLRTMGDVDILISPENRDPSHRVMLGLGYERIEKGLEVWEYQKQKMLAEIHTNLIMGEPWNGVDVEKYFEDAMAHTEEADGMTRRFTKEYHLIYLVIHAAKHFRYTGYGIRGIMDFSVYLKRYLQQLNWDEIWEELGKLRLEKFAKAMFSVCHLWFGTALPEEIEEPDVQTYEGMSERIFEGGVYGYFNRNLEMAQVRNQLAKDRSGRLLMLKARALLKLIFPGVRYMRHYMDALAKRPYLLPAAWVVRWYQAIFRRGAQNIGRMREFARVGEDVREEYELFRKLDLMQ